MTALYAAMSVAQRSSASIGRKIVTQQDARTVLDIMAMEIRMASYNPAMTPATWQIADDSHCSGKVTLLSANKGIQTAKASEIAVAMDLDASQSIANNSSDNEYIVYKYEDNILKRSVTCGGLQQMLGGNNSDTHVKNAEVRKPLFEYFDRDDHNLADASGNIPETSIPHIRRVRITLVADTKNPDSLTGKIRRMTYTTDVLVKNHVLSP